MSPPSARTPCWSNRNGLEFEFDLPYSDGSRMGLVAEAKAAFGKRLGVAL